MCYTDGIIRDVDGRDPALLLQVEKFGQDFFRFLLDSNIGRKTKCNLLKSVSLLGFSTLSIRREPVFVERV